MKLVIVVQRYGADINGGAELHARYVAERLSAHADVRVLTTCARDYVTWRNECAPGEERVNGIPVERFAVARERDTIDFRDRSSRLFGERHSIHDELGWLESQGPTSPTLMKRLSRVADECDFVLAVQRPVQPRVLWRALRRAEGGAGPTAERESALGVEHLPAGFSRRARDHVQLLRRACADHDALIQYTRARRRGRCRLADSGCGRSCTRAE